jgi:hypothetical protein
MKWLSYVACGLISFAFGIVFTYWIQGQLVYESIRNFIITGASLGVIFGLLTKGVDMFNMRRSEKKDEKEKAMVDLGKHTEAIIPILKEWAETPLDSSKEYLLSLAQQHIMNGYEQLWGIIEGTTGIRQTQSQYENLEKETLQSVRDVFKKQLLEASQKVEDATVDDLAIAIKSFLERHSQGKSYTFSAKQSLDPSAKTGEYVLRSLKNNGSVSNTYLKGDRKSLSALADIMNNVLSDSHLQELTKNLRTLATRLYELRNTFKQRISSIIDKITSAVSKEDKILLGNCTQCADIKKKWKIA